MTEPEVAAEMSSDGDIDPNRQLQRSLQSTCRPYLRKHSRSSSNDTDYDYDESDLESEESGQFDDAEEEPASPPHLTTRSPSVHSAKRRRSNDWPLNQDEDTAPTQTQTQTQKEAPGNQRWHFHGHGRSSSAHGSPRTSGKHGRSGIRGRRSRFVEGSMNDSVSEKPPSIFLREDGRTKGKSATTTAAHGAGQRHSGIFRFGKAIASAFNPFGVFGNVSDIWKGPPEGHKPAEDPLAQAERAYAELKKAGYKGTNKGGYMQNPQGTSSTIPDETWKAIQETMDYKPVGRHSRQNSGEGPGSSSSIRSSFQELRKARSSLGIPSSLLVPPTRRSDESEGPEVRRQKSRKELQRQAKLLKRVSDLEEKLEKARRELQTLMGEDEHPEKTYCVDKSHRKFVPGALPSLPSERVLQSDAKLPASPVSEVARLSSLLETAQRAVEDQGVELHNLKGEKSAATTSKPIDESQPQMALTVDSPSRKRKSPDPKTIKRSETSHLNQGNVVIHNDERQDDNKSLYPGEVTPSRKAKLPKMVRQDSPGSVERKQTRDHGKQNEGEARSPGEDRGRRTTPLRSASQRSPSARRRASNTRNQGTPCLRMKKGCANLRSVNPSDDLATTPNNNKNDQDQDKENQHDDVAVQRFYLHDEHQIDHDQITTPSPSPTKRKDTPKYNYSYIPPVPPIPKDLAATAAKVDRRLAKEMGKKREARIQRSKGQPGHPMSEPNIDEVFKWPDDIF